MTKDNKVKTRAYVGIDLGKKSLEAKRISRDNKVDGLSVKTDREGASRLLDWLDKGDLVALEAGNLSFRIARLLIAEGHEVVILNPGDLAIIYRSLKKTDKEDALKLARLIQRIPVSELPVVSLPTPKEEYQRRLISDLAFQKKVRTMLVNRLHSLFAQAGFTQLTKKDLKDAQRREGLIGKLEEYFVAEAKQLHEQIEGQDEALLEIDKKIKEALKSETELLKIYMSMPGIGPQNALALIAYIGNGGRFSHPKQVSHYAGLIPKVDISGDSVHYGRITKRGCSHIRALIVQAAWSLVRSNKGGYLKKKYEVLSHRIGKKKAIVAIARKMLEALYIMARNSKIYKYIDEPALEKKLRSYGLLSG